MAKGRPQDHYEVLGVSPETPDEVIRAAYRALAAKYHPDRNPGDRDADLKLKRLNAAFHVLGDPDKRKQYDELTQSPDARDEPPQEAPKKEPPRWKIPEEPAPEGPRWKVPGEDDLPRSNTTSPAEPSRVEKGASYAAGGFRRLIAWVFCFGLLAAAIAAFPGPGSCGEKGRGNYSSALTTATTQSAAITASPHVAPSASGSAPFSSVASLVRHPHAQWVLQVTGSDSLPCIDTRCLFEVAETRAGAFPRPASSQWECRFDHAVVASATLVPQGFARVVRAIACSNDGWRTLVEETCGYMVGLPGTGYEPSTSGALLRLQDGDGSQYNVSLYPCLPPRPGYGDACERYPELE
jgi:hypothetical protein